MFAPKPAVRGNGHAAIIRVHKVNKDLVIPSKFDEKREAAITKLAENHHVKKH